MAGRAMGRRKGRAESGRAGGKLALNNQDLHSVREIASQYPSVEFLYLRENQFDSFDPYIPLENLKMLDLSLNNLQKCDFLWGGESVPAAMKPENLQLPALRHLYLTGNQIESLEGFTGLDLLETLALSSNRIKSFEGLGSLQNLRVLSLNFNEIENFRHLPFLPCLHSLNLVGNPVDPDAATKPEEHTNFRTMAITVSTSQLAKIDGVAVTPEEHEEGNAQRGKVMFCMMEGFVPQVPSELDVEDQADEWLLRDQQDKTQQQPLRLLSSYLAPGRRKPFPAGHPKEGYPGDKPPQEGVPITLNICLQDTREYAKRKRDIFHCPFLYPVAFKVTGDATEVYVVGSMNQWGEKIKLEKIVETKDDGTQDIFFQTNLYLPPGDWEYRYIVDGIQKVSDENKRSSKQGKGMCNYYLVKSDYQPEEDEEAQETILHVRWLRNNRYNGFTLIPDENTLTYTPTLDDVECCLRAEVLSYLEGDFSSMFYDITCTIAAGEPTVTKIGLDDHHRVGETVQLSVEYTGGREGPSEVRWLRVREGEEEDVTQHAQEVFCYPLTADDVGAQIKVQYTPIRDDGEVYDEYGEIVPRTKEGEMREAVTSTIAAA